MNTSFDILLSTADYSNTKEKFSITKCSACGLRQTQPQPTPENITKYYEMATYISHKEKAIGLIDFIYLQARIFTLRWKLSVIQSISDKKRLLDFGCGAGDFLKYCLSKGYDATGYEPIKPAAKITEVKTNTSVFTQLNQIHPFYSLITLWHVLEHVHKLNETIQHLKSILEKDGIIFIAVPNHKSYDATTYKHYWAGYDVPRHLWHFDKTTMNQLMEKHNLKVKKIIPMRLDPYYISLVSEQYKSPEKNLIVRMTNSIIMGWKSNVMAKTTGEYSSLIYVIQHA
jgi:2-polyprenyl-3-methyl-5-hydroxy-6-metoxy-1,4-benzoquinol methylase